MQTARIFVAGYGDDANDGSLATPKRTLQAAQNAVSANGEIVILDTAGYGNVNITKNLGINAPLRLISASQCQHSTEPSLWAVFFLAT